MFDDFLPIPYAESLPFGIKASRGWAGTDTLH